MSFRMVFASLCCILLLFILAAAEKPPAQYKSSGKFEGGTVSSGVIVSGVRFGIHSTFTRMVLDLDQLGEDSQRSPATDHPAYCIEYFEHPYRLVIHLEGTSFDPESQIQANPALPFSVVTPPDGTIKEMQVYLAGPSEFKVIEVDDPAKLAIDVRPAADTVIPTVYSVQLKPDYTAEQAFNLIESSEFPEGFEPYVLVLGELIIVEQAFSDPAEAARIDAALRDMGYASVINERQGDELPLG